MKDKQFGVGDLRQVINSVEIKVFMIFPPVILNHNEDFHKVETILREKKIKHLPIVNDDEQLVGLITLSDLYRTCSPRRRFEDGSFFYDKSQLDSFILKNVMTKNPFTLKEKNTLKDALDVMVRGGFGCIPVVDDNRNIKGIVTQTDIIRIVTVILGIHSSVKK